MLNRLVPAAGGANMLPEVVLSVLLTLLLLAKLKPPVEVGLPNTAAALVGAPKLKLGVALKFTLGGSGFVGLAGASLPLNIKLGPFVDPELKLN